MGWATQVTKTCMTHSRGAVSDALDEDRDDIKFAWQLWIRLYTHVTKKCVIDRKSVV